MRELIARVTAQINRLWERTEKRDRIRFFVIAGVALVAIIVAVILLSQTEYSVLYRDLDPSEAGKYMETLSDLGIPAQAVGTGTIMIPTKDLSRVSMQMASQQPTTGLTYDTFAKGGGFGMTDFEKRKYDQFQTQDRLQEAIEENSGVRRAIVTIALPDNRRVIFKGDVAKPTASVMLIMENGKTLPVESVVAIENLVASSVQGLDPKDVSILDNALNLLNRGDGLDLSSFNSHLEYESAVREELTRTVRNLLAPVFGIEHVQVGVNLKMDFDEKSTESITFSPVNTEDLQGIDVSFRKITEQATGVELPQGTAGVDSNGAAPIMPETEQNIVPNYKKITEEANREVNQVQEKINKAQGSISQLTVSVLLDENMLRRDPNDPTKADLTDPAANVATLRGIIGGACGLKPNEQQDLINVSLLPFAGMDADNEVYSAYERERGNSLLYDLIRSVALYAIIAACIIVVILTLGRMFRRKPSEEELAATRALDAAAAVGLTAEELEMQELLKLASDDTESIEDRVSPVREKIEDFIDRNPEAVASLLRNWLANDDERW